MIERKEYLEQLFSYKNQQLIKVITGVRRCGKSTLFALYIEKLKKMGVSEEQIIDVNLEELEYKKLQDYNELYSYIEKRLHKKKYTYIFIDEVQMCEGFEQAVDSLFIKPMVDVYITGSNAYMLSGELATLLSGRYVTIDMLPLSFKEYFKTASNIDMNKSVSFNNYIKYGGFPYLTNLKQEDNILKPYLEGVYNTILLKDVAKRAEISDITLLENIIKTLMSSIGSTASIKKISNTLTSTGRKTSRTTIDKYIRALCDSYLFYKADRYDVKGRQYLKTQSKYYTVDTGLRNMLIMSESFDIGHQIENIVYLELLRRRYRVNIGKVDIQEVDFIVNSGDDTHYYQVAASVMDESTLARELVAFQKISDNHPKTLLTLDEIGDGANYNGIRQKNLIDWLLD